MGEVMELAFRLPWENAETMQRKPMLSRPWQSFDTLKAGDVIGTRANGEVVRAPHDGYIVFPNAVAEANNEWFYLAEATDRFSVSR